MPVCIWLFVENNAASFLFCLVKHEALHLLTTFLVLESGVGWCRRLHEFLDVVG